MILFKKLLNKNNFMDNIALNFTSMVFQQTICDHQILYLSKDCLPNEFVIAKWLKYML